MLLTDSFEINNVHKSVNTKVYMSNWVLIDFNCSAPQHETVYIVTCESMLFHCSVATFSYIFFIRIHSVIKDEDSTIVLIYCLYFHFFYLSFRLSVIQLSFFTHIPYFIKFHIHSSVYLLTKPTPMHFLQDYFLFKLFSQTFGISHSTFCL